MKKLVSALMVTSFAVACVSADDPNRRTKTGAGVGAAAGAVIGGVVGNQSGNPRTGAAVGAAVGAGVGAAVGRRMDNQQRELEQINGLEVNRTADDELAVVLRNDVLFDVDSSSLRSASRETLRDISSVFNRYGDTNVIVEGHADSSGEASYNQRLSERRAESVRGYLVTEGVSRSRITARGLGESSPRASNDTADGRQLNRRVEIRIRANQS